MKTQTKAAAEIQSGEILAPTNGGEPGEVVWTEPHNGGIRMLISTDYGEYHREFYATQPVGVITREDLDHCGHDSCAQRRSCIYD